MKPMPEFMAYLPMLLTVVLGLTLVTNVIVQVLKGLLYDRIPTNLLAFFDRGSGDHRGGLCPVVLLWIFHYRVDDCRPDCPVFSGGVCRHVWL